MIPSVVWGWFFVSRNPESRQLVVVTFLLGTLSVVPLLLFMAGLGVHLQVHDAAAAALRRAGFPAAGAQPAAVLLAGVALVLVGVIKLVPVDFDNGSRATRCASAPCCRRRCCWWWRP